MAAASARLHNAREERDQFYDANDQIVAHLKTRVCLLFSFDNQFFFCLASSTSSSKVVSDMDVYSSPLHFAMSSLYCCRKASYLRPLAHVEWKNTSLVHGSNFWRMLGFFSLPIQRPKTRRPSMLQDLPHDHSSKFQKRTFLLHLIL